VTTGAGADRFEVRVTADSHFAWLRTRMAVERTMMAYMRTAVSLIGFGFAIFQFVYNLHGSPEAGSVRYPHAAWYLSLAMIACGVFAALFSLFEYHRQLNYLRSGGFAALAGTGSNRTYTPLYAITAVQVVIGLFAFFAVLLRIS
jgi:putative membrane protein